MQGAGLVCSELPAAETKYLRMALISEVPPVLSLHAGEGRACVFKMWFIRCYIYHSGCSLPLGEVLWQWVPAQPGGWCLPGVGAAPWLGSWQCWGIVGGDS